MRRFDLISIDKIRYFLFPLLAGIFPAFFHYGNNSRVVLISTLGKLLVIFALISLITYVIFSLIYRAQSLKAALASSVFLIFFHTYGIVFDQLRQWDWFTIEQYTFFPAYILLALYFGWLVSRIHQKTSRNLWDAGSVVLGLLIIFNIIKILPVEVKKVTHSGEQSTVKVSNQLMQTTSAYPDIYYIIFDEMAGFNAIRQYWKYDAIDNFVADLKLKGFYVAENSHGSSDNTYHELATRLNYEDYPYDPDNYQRYWDEDLGHLPDNKALQYLKSLGYTTIVFDEGLPLSVKFNADAVYTSSLNEILSWGSAFDEFGLLVLNNTMFEPFINKLMTDSSANNDHERMLVFTVDQMTKLDYPSPKFVYIHLLIPHMPFLFDANGHRIDLKRQYDWDQYLGYYIFSTQFAKSLIENILKSADAAHPPVIVFQSDHGARNISMEAGNVLLENYPLEYRTLIVNDLFLPGCEDAPLSQDMDPVKTFPIIFDCYFDANISLK